MAILIEGMEMPTTCGSCWFCHAVSNEKWHCRLTGKSFASYSVGWGNENNTGENGQRPYIRRDDCPLIEVHEPHGDLIDREELQHIIGQFNLNWEYGQGVSDCWDALLNAPTVIQASEEGET